MGQVIAKQSGRSLPDLPTVIAIALVAYAASNVLHEAVGHGGACLALGGKPLVLSSVHFECGEQAMSALALRGVAAAGTIVNFIIGALALIVFKTANPLHKPHAAYFLWLFTTLNLLSGAGYFLFSGVGGIGDWADVARGTMPPLVWRPALSVFGGALYFLLARQSAQWLGSLAGSGELSMRRSKRLTVPAYIAGGLLSASPDCSTRLAPSSSPFPLRQLLSVAPRGFSGLPGSCVVASTQQYQPPRWTEARSGWPQDASSR